MTINILPMTTTATGSRRAATRRRVTAPRRRPTALSRRKERTQTANAAKMEAVMLLTLVRKYGTEDILSSGLIKKWLTYR